MHAKALEIAWHERTPIWSIDIACTNRLVTAGGDKIARVWRINPSTEAYPVEWLCDLRAHLTTVNVARFDRFGQFIATGADQGEIVLWHLSDEVHAVSPLENDEENAPKERWVRKATLRGHVQDVLDLSWASDGNTLVSASVDNSIMIWDVRQPSRPPVTLRAHSNFVQGVSIDPVGKIVASLGNDRTFRVFSRAGQAPWAQTASLTSITSDARLFQDDSKSPTFFRRLSWSPDGSVVACPSGLHYPQTKRLYAVHVFARFQWSQPAAQCGGLTSPACAIRFSPVLYSLRKETSAETPLATQEALSSTASQSSSVSGEVLTSKGRKVGPFEGFTYRMVFAVACIDSILFYDTESFSRPFAKVDGLHCAELTDLCWSPDGTQLFVSSVDGYVSVISFGDDELGTPLPESNVPRWLREYNLAKQERMETSFLIKGNRVTAPAPVKSPSFARPNRKTELVAPIKTITLPSRVAPGSSPKRLKGLAPPTPQTENETREHPKAGLSEKDEEKGTVTLRPLEGNGSSGEHTVPTQIPPVTRQEAGLCVEEVRQDNNKKSAPERGCSVQQTLSPKSDVKAPTVTVVVPRRRAKPVTNDQSLVPDSTKANDQGTSEGLSEASQQAVNSTSVQSSEPKRQTKAGSLVQTVFAKFVSGGGAKVTNKRNLDQSLPGSGENKAELKRRKTVSADMIDLT